MNTNKTKPLLKSRTIWGIIATVVLSVTGAYWKGYRDTNTWEGGVDNALPMLITIFPATYAGHGRKVAEATIK